MASLSALYIYSWQNDNTSKAFTYNDFSYHINKYDFTYMFFLFSVINKVISKQNHL